MMVRQAIIPAAGLSRRLHPFTLGIPKIFLPVSNGDSEVIMLLEHLLDELIKAHITRIGIVCSPLDKRLYAAALESIIGRFDAGTVSRVEEIKLIRQPVPDGLGGAILACEKWLHDNPFAVVLGDHWFKSTNHVPVLRQLVEKSGRSKKNVLGVYLKSDIPNRSYVNIRHDEQSGNIYMVDRIDTRSGPVGILMEGDHIPLYSPEKWCVMGAYIAQTDTFKKLHNLKRKVGEGSEIPWIDLIRSQVREGRVGAVNVDGESIEVGDPEQLAEYYRVHVPATDDS